MKRLLVLLAALPLTATAADVVPQHLTGTWGTGASLYEGKEQQADIYLRADGYGIMAGSTAPAYRADGVDDGKPGPRALLGFPLRARLDGDTLILRPFLPKGVPGMKGEIIIPCRQDRATQTLACTTPADNQTMLLKQRSQAIPAEVEKMLEQVIALEDR